MGPLAPVVTTLRRTPPLVFAMAVLATGMVLASSVLVKGLRRGNDTITVTGASTERITSDFVDWTVEVSQSAPTLEASYQQLQPEVERTVAFLQQQGIPAEAIRRNPVKSERSEVRDSRTGALQSTTFTTRPSPPTGARPVDTPPFPPNDDQSPHLPHSRIVPGGNTGAAGVGALPPRTSPLQVPFRRGDRNGPFYVPSWLLKFVTFAFHPGAVGYRRKKNGGLRTSPFPNPHPRRRIAGSPLSPSFPRLPARMGGGRRRCVSAGGP